MSFRFFLPLHASFLVEVDLNATIMVLLFAERAATMSFFSRFFPKFAFKKLITESIFLPSSLTDFRPLTITEVPADLGLPCPLCPLLAVVGQVVVIPSMH